MTIPQTNANLNMNMQKIILVRGLFISDSLKSAFNARGDKDNDINEFRALLKDQMKKQSSSESALQQQHKTASSNGTEGGSTFGSQIVSKYKHILS